MMIVGGLMAALGVAGLIASHCVNKANWDGGSGYDDSDYDDSDYDEDRDEEEGRRGDGGRKKVRVRVKKGGKGGKGGDDEEGKPPAYDTLNVFDHDATSYDDYEDDDEDEEDYDYEEEDDYEYDEY